MTMDAADTAVVPDPDAMAWINHRLKPDEVRLGDQHHGQNKRRLHPGSQDADSRRFLRSCDTSCGERGSLFWTHLGDCQESMTV